MELSIKEAMEATGGQLLCGSPNRKIDNICLNSEKAGPGSLFVPVVGARVDAHRFLPQVFLKGAACALTAEHTQEDLKEGKDAALCAALQKDKGAALLAVDNTVSALQRLGAYYRKNKVHIPLIGVTGSVGKTTTREMIACALSAGKTVFATRGNANSQVGVPITMTEIGPEAQIGVVELGMSEFGEMTRISMVARPDSAVITNIGISHINQLKTQENILIQKLHILDGMPDGALLLLNGDDPLLRGLTEEDLHARGIAEGKRVHIVFYGMGENCAVRAEKITTAKGCPSFEVVFDGFPKEGACMRYQASLSCMGMHMVSNALAAFALAAFYGVSPEKAAIKLAGFSDLAGRGARFVSASGVTVIDDSYNAAPASMKAGISVLMDTPAKRHIAVLADMLELGKEEAAYHREVGAFIARAAQGLDQLYLYGPLSRFIAEGMGLRIAKVNTRHFADQTALYDALKTELKAGDAVLFKGSNSMGLSGLVSRLF